MYAIQFISGKANVVRRQFYLAHLLLGEALLYAQEIFGKHHLRYADCLMGKFDFALGFSYFDWIMFIYKAGYDLLSLQSL